MEKITEIKTFQERKMTVSSLFFILIKVSRSPLEIRNCDQCMEGRLKSRLQSHKQISFLTYLILVIGFQGLQVGVWWKYQSMTSRVVFWSVWFSCASRHTTQIHKYRGLQTVCQVWI